MTTIPNPTAAPNPYASAPRPTHRGGIQRLVRSVLRLVDLQVQIWLTHAKLTLHRIAIYSALFAIASLLALLAIIFLYIGVFHVLTDVVGLRPVWAYLIYGTFHALVALILIAIATKTLNQKDPQESPKAHVTT